MPRVKVGPALPDVSTLDARDRAPTRISSQLRFEARSHNVFRRRPRPHLPRHLLFRCSWPTDFRPSVSAIWMSRADVFSMVLDHPKMPASARWECERANR